MTRRTYIAFLVLFGVACGDDDRPVDAGSTLDSSTSDLGGPCAAGGEDCSAIRCCDLLTCERLITPDTTRSVCEPEG